MRQKSTADAPRAFIDVVRQLESEKIAKVREMRVPSHPETSTPSTRSLRGFEPQRSSARISLEAERVRVTTRTRRIKS